MKAHNDETYRRWVKEVLEPFLAKYPEMRERFVSTSGFDFERLALPDAERSYENALGYPGSFPYTRGVTPAMYRGKLWTMRQYSGFATAEETNRRYHYLIDRGQTGLSVAFDLPTQMGYDSNHPRARGEVGRCGVAIDTAEDMARLFDGIPLDKVSTSMTINAPAVVLLAQYIAVAEKQGVGMGKLAGTIQNDILKEYMARGTYIFPPEPSIALTVDSFRFCSRNLPRWNMISISGYHIREAGSSAVQEVAFTLADGIFYCEKAVEAGMSIDSFAGRLSFFFNAHNNFLEEVAKFRAARRLWAKTMRNRFKAKDPRSELLRFHTQTAGSMLTAQQPLNNAVRVTLQALAAVLGGTQSLHTNAYDEALALPGEESVKLALRTQQIIANESGVADTVDPLGGSFFIEDLTDKIEAGAAAYIEKIDEMGGMLKAIESGYPQAEIRRQAYQWQREVESGERPIVGLNVLTDDAAETDVPLLHPTQEAEDGQVARLASYIQARDASSKSAVAASLDGVTKAAEKRAEICEATLAAVKAGATEGEIVSAMERVWGRHREDSV